MTWPARLAFSGRGLADALKDSVRLGVGHLIAEKIKIAS
jgi:hypothetical protein